MLYFSILAIGMAVAAVILLPLSYLMTKLLVLAPPAIPLIQQHQHHIQVVLDSSLSVSGVDIGIVKQIIYGPMTILTDASFSSVAKIFAVQVLR